MFSMAARLSVAATALLIASCGIEAAEQTTERTAAHEIAERFSEPASSAKPVAGDGVAKSASPKVRHAAGDGTRKHDEDAARRAAEQAKAYEVEMLARARAEAEERRATQQSKRAEQEQADAEAARQAAAKSAEADRARQEADRRRVAEHERLITEAKAQAAELERAEVAKQAAAREAAVRAEAEAQRAAEAKRAEEARLAAEAKALAEQHERRAEAERVEQLKALTQRREAESKQLAERLKAAEEARAAKEAALATEAAARETAGKMRPAGHDEPTVQSSSTSAGTRAQSVVAEPREGAPARATVLLVMEPGKKGIRRFNKTADPVLCVRDGCYVSEGPDRAALFKTRAGTLGIGNTWGRRAGACQHALVCTFRNVDLAAAGGFLQPVDMKVMIHDRRESQIVTSDSECGFDGQRLSCRRAVTSANYRMWIVPEDLASRVGGAVLESALRDELPSSESARLAR